MSEPRLAWETHFAAHGYTRLAGVDEVGRGALAGPIVACAIVLPRLSRLMLELDFWSQVVDSKTLSARRRETLAEGILNRVRDVQLCRLSSQVVDQIGIEAANRLAMEHAVLELKPAPDLLLIDAKTIDLPQPQLGLIDGDALSVSIAAASIVAKVARDAEMIALDQEFPHYGFARNKGYGAPVHLLALKEHGPCDHHRFSWAPIRMLTANNHGIQ